MKAQERTELQQILVEAALRPIVQRFEDALRRACVSAAQNYESPYSAMASARNIVEAATQLEAVKGIARQAQRMRLDDAGELKINPAREYSAGVDDRRDVARKLETNVEEHMLNFVNAVAGEIRESAMNAIALLP
jgi:hypothetical protein